tara:strand:- start:187 stop:483 length:297 start_codon:yes stop_codon:yes gene_type:complete
MMSTHKGESHKTIAPMNMKVDVEKRNLIDYAANLLGQDRTRFVVDAALHRAEDVILDRRVFALDDVAFDAFVKVLNEPRPQETERCLNTFLSRPKRWK